MAFDSSCGKCSKISRVVDRASGGRLETMPLAHPDVQRWRERYFGSPGPWKPTLVRLRGTEVRCWVGASMAYPLARRLGVRTTVRVLDALGEMSWRHQRMSRDRVNTEDSGAVYPVGRKHFLRLGAGMAAAAGLMVTGRTPVFAQSDHAAARAWVEANRGRLPHQYSAFSAHSLVRRRLIFSELPPAARRDLWLEHLNHHRATRGHHTPQQQRVMEQVSEAFADESAFRDGFSPGTEERLRAAAVEAFGRDEAHAILATLGPVESGRVSARSAAQQYCDCSKEDSWCGEWDVCLSQGCVEVPFTCGTGWVYTCNGTCVRAAP
ncbi:hypothetical protein CQJ94_00905 [Glycomyces fuscus]|nr:hypothetical protein CQJ94_00905 [Glycomyces fuscus]